MERLTARSEDYLKTIYKLEQENKVVRVKDLAQALGVKSPTVVGSLYGLKEAGLVIQGSYGYVTLSDEGKVLAEELIGRERILVDFFEKILNLGEEEARTNACSIEHYITPACRERLISFIKFLSHCHYGSPRWLEHFKEFVETGEKPQCDNCPQKYGSN
ncbi:iron (metal) dependent repressor, DtxR family [Thermovirga lienii DSM 17291]|jgi:DtxR family Mn-dependent transcriptional regulator|uniref:Iron (Metal) dependent repressor, DtxR family n=1 Tax=Thermovirga lienii (strain ATCC BAA-1197 / DSM 17291 / Cas60314) TaxID=580340 RepID=G7V6X2_THELD|nr:metal-dependent transcriptional regulator [Thermovirga lienii]MDN5319169.1 DtxR family transcriptional regulator, Mn-dependent transcriptional regulator [Thermovirga sp.]AER67161.1 iron (metal) dependent repressor, DtxR family [Thermovirga lienii DSM 17291]KUK42588.1 MAG: Iron (Metal) dependent repressor, DtxR family [Thermovirga lienii]MDN5367764.1 DtxR family transcriptional regulator, Mn-dependent transcriptional regulator [Thermovirga sp.]HCD72137.1 metal-dependent transcriptional regul